MVLYPVLIRSISAGVGGAVAASAAPGPRAKPAKTVPLAIRASRRDRASRVVVVVETRPLLDGVTTEKAVTLSVTNAVASNSADGNKNDLMVNLLCWFSWFCVSVLVSAPLLLSSLQCACAGC